MDLRILAWVYLLWITAAEIIVGYVNVSLGMGLHLLLLIAILVHATLSWYRSELRLNQVSVAAVVSQPRLSLAAQLEGRILAVPDDFATSDEVVGGLKGTFGTAYKFYLGLALAPLIRILSLSMPLNGIPIVYFYIIVGAPLFLAAIVVIRICGLRLTDIGLVTEASRLSFLPVQLGIGLLGIPMGMIEYWILQPKPLVTDLDPRMLVIGSLILIIFTGLLEELIFRGILQYTARRYFGDFWAIIYVSLLFAVLHITHLSVVDVFFVLDVAILYSLFVRRTRSILGVTLAHGLTNISLYILWPLFFR